jgi:hypothetical protein
MEDCDPIIAGGLTEAKHVGVHFEKSSFWTFSRVGQPVAEQWQTPVRIDAHPAPNLLRRGDSRNLSPSTGKKRLDCFDPNHARLCHTRCVELCCLRVWSTLNSIWMSPTPDIAPDRDFLDG